MNNLVHCYRCSGTYNSNLQYTRGFVTKSHDTTGDDNFVHTSSVSSGDCPFCNKPPLLVPKQQSSAM
jgi:hypothetical protein